MAGNPFEGTRPFIPTDGGGPAEALRRGAERADRYAEARDKYGRGAFTDLSVTNIARDLDQYMHVQFGGKGWEEEENFDPEAEDYKPLLEELNPQMQERFKEEAVSDAHARDLLKRLKQEQEVYQHASTDMGSMFLATMLSGARDPAFIGTTVATLGAGAGISTLAKGVQMASKTRGALAAAEVVGLTGLDAGIYTGMKAYNNDNYTSEDAMVEVGYSLLFAAPFGAGAGALTSRVARQQEAAGLAEVEEAVGGVVRSENTGVVETPTAEPISLKPEEQEPLVDLKDIEKRVDRLVARRKKRNPELNEAEYRKKLLDEKVEAATANIRLTREFDETKQELKRAAETMVEHNSRRASALTFQQLTPQGRLDVIKNAYVKQLESKRLSPEAKAAAERELDAIDKGTSKWNKRVHDDNYWKAPEPEPTPKQVEVSDELTRQETELDELESQFDGDREQWAGKIHRQDLYGMVQKSMSPTMRNVGHELYSDPIRSAKNPQGISADLLSQAKANGNIEKTNYRISKRIHKLMRKEGVNRLNVNAQYTKMEEIADRVYDVILTGQKSGIKELDEMAEIIQERVKESLELAKRYGAAGSRNVEASPDYLPRVYKQIRVQEELQKPGGLERMHSVFRKALMEANETLPKAAAELVARGMVKALRRDKMDSLDDVFQDKEKLRELLEEIAMEQKGPDQSVQDYLDEAFEVLADRKAQKQTNKKDYMDRLKQRADLNVFARSDDGQLVLRDLLNTNAFAITEQYTREMAGEAALASKGLSGPDAIRRVRDKIKSELVREEMDGAVVEKELERFDNMIDNVRNRPTHFRGMSAKQKATMSTLLQYNSLVMLGMAGLAGMAEFMGATFRAGVVATLKGIPALRKNSVSIAKEIEKQGFAMDKMYYNMYFNHYEETGLYGATSFAARLGHAAMKTTATVSLMRGFDQFARRTLWTTALDKSAAMARKKGNLYFTKDELGLSDADYAKVVNHMKDSVETTKGVFSDSINTMNFDKWLDANGEVDTALIDKFLSGMYRMSSNQTLRVLSGERVRWVENPLGQFIFQFQTLLLSGIYKSLGNKLANPGQAATWTTLMGEVVGGTMWYYARNQIKMAGMSESDRREWEKEHLTPEKIATGGIGYTTSFGGAFSLYNKASTPFGLPAFGQRYANTTADALFANPTLSMGESAARIIGDAAQLDMDEDTVRNAGSLAPLKSWYPMYYITNSIMDD